ncbi:hypothetical protein GUY44_09650, partial [Pimelobacter simplex]
MEQPDRSDASLWTASDYLLRSEFCPPAQIQGELDRLRLAHGAEWVVLLAFDADSFLRNLIFVSTRSAEHHAAITARIKTTNFRRWTPRSMSASAVRDAVRAELVAEAAPVDSPAHADRLPGERVGPSGLAYWLVSDQESASGAALRRDSAPFADMLNGTVVATISRDLRIGRQVLNAMPRAVGGPEARDVREAQVSALVELAQDVASASDVGLYLADRSSSELHLDPSHSVMRGADLPTRIPYGDDAVRGGALEALGRSCYRESATRLWPPPSTHGTAPAVDSPARSSVACLVIPYSLAGRSIPNLGILVVRRSPDHGSQHFNNVELALLRNVALRLAFALSQMRFDRIGSLQAELTRQLGAGFAGEPQDANRDISVAEGVPWDIQLAQRELTTLIRRVQEVTQSASVTLRVLTPGWQDGESGLVLRRYLSTSSADESHQDLPLEGKDGSGRARWRQSANTFAAVTGEKVHLWDLDRPLGQQCPNLIDLVRVPERASVGSELCFPVYSGSALVGTMNLESPNAGAFLADESSIATFAALAGTTISATRSQIMLETVNRSSTLRMGLHEAWNVDKLVAHLAEGAPPETRAALEELREYALRPPVAPPQGGLRVNGTGTDFGSLVEDSLDRLPITTHPGVRLYDSPLVAEEAIPPVTAILDELLRNLAQHDHRERHIDPVVAVSALELGGREHAVFRIRNAPKNLPSARFLAQGYNYPFYKDQVDHASLGCYTVGNLARG